MKPNILSILVLIMFFSCQTKKDVFVCTPCDLPCDELIFHEPGICPHCKMKLINKNDLVPEKELKLNEIDIQNGNGKFLIEGGFYKEKTILVHYYKPQTLKADSPVIMVLPGAGRNGDDYRDAWIAKSEKYNVLVLSLEYSEKHYPGFPSYNMAGMITDVELNDKRTAVTNFKISITSSEWIYDDFDRVFNSVKRELQLNTDTYDMFGHSAGGQILHRMALFKSGSKANRILASNSGWYTLPMEHQEFPYGLENSTALSENIDFSSKLILFLGAKDDANETRGDVRHTPEADMQGLHRLARGKYFYQKAKEVAAEMNAEFHWKLEIIPNIGHDYKNISTAAADFLYKTEE